MKFLDTEHLHLRALWRYKNPRHYYHPILDCSVFMARQLATTIARSGCHAVTHVTKASGLDG